MSDEADPRIRNCVMLDWSAASMGVGMDMTGFDLKTTSGKPAEASLRPKE